MRAGEQEPLAREARFVGERFVDVVGDCGRDAGEIARDEDGTLAVAVLQHQRLDEDRALDPLGRFVAAVVARHPDRPIGCDVGAGEAGEPGVGVFLGASQRCCENDGGTQHGRSDEV